MFLFSEVDDRAEAARLMEEAGTKFDDERYERKVAGLLRRAYRQDRKRWRSMLGALRDEDFYGLVMIEQAGLPMPGRRTGGPAEDWLGLARTFLAILPDALIAIPCFLVCVDPFGWKLLESYTSRAAVFAVSGVALWLVASRRR
jgi:hypothetical protein